MATLTTRTADEIMAMKFEPEDCILGDRLLSKGNLTAILGPSGTGKSRLVHQLIACCVSGRDFIGFPVKPQKLQWLILQAENDNQRLQVDLAHLKTWLGPVHWPAFQAQVLFHTLETDLDSFVFLERAEHKQRLSELVALRNWDCVVFDALQNYTVGDLKKDDVMFSTITSISMLAKLGNPRRLIILLHHSLTGKAGVIKAVGQERAGYGRGSKVLHMLLRSQINVTNANPDNYDQLIISCGKCSNGKEFEPFAVYFDPNTHIYEVDNTIDVKAWATNVKRNKSGPLIDDAMVATACTGSVNKADVAAALQAKVNCSRTTAFDAIKRALKSGAIILDATTQFLRRK